MEYHRPGDPVALWILPAQAATFAASDRDWLSDRIHHSANPIFR